jgi:hypothetical protein
MTMQEPLVAGDLHHATFGGEVALQDDEADLREADLEVAAYLTERVRAENGQSGRKVVAIDEKREAVTC